MRKGRDGGKKKRGAKKEENMDENSGHYVIASSRPPERRPLKRRMLVPILWPSFYLSYNPIGISPRWLTLLNPRSEIASKTWGGAKCHPLEINKGAPWDLMLQKVILKPIKVMITCKKLAPYLKISMRYWHLKIWRQWDFVIPWPTKIAVTRLIFEIEGSSFGFIFVCSTNATLQLRLFVCSTIATLQLRLYDQFLKKSFF